MGLRGTPAALSIPQVLWKILEGARRASQGPHRGVVVAVMSEVGQVTVMGGHAAASSDSTGAQHEPAPLCSGTEAGIWLYWGTFLTL